MGLIDFIERLRGRSVREREQWALSIALGVTTFIFLVWLAVFMSRLQAPTDVSSVSSQAVASTSVESPFDTISQTFKDAYQTIQEGINAVGSVNYQPQGAQK